MEKVIMETIKRKLQHHSIGQNRFLEQEYCQGKKAHLIIIKTATHQEDLILKIHASNNRSSKQDH